MPLFGSNSTHDDPRATAIRTCGKCKADAVSCYHVTVHYVNGLPAGRTYSHKCQKCGRLFETISAWRTIRDAFFTMFAGLFALFMVPFGTMRIVERGITGAEGGDWVLFVIGWILGIGAVAVGVSTAVKTYRLFENPIARPASPLPR